MNSINFADTLIARVAVAVVISMLLCYRSLREARDWSLADALSEEVELTKTEAAGTPIDAAGTPLATGQLPLAPYLINKFSSFFSIFKL